MSIVQLTSATFCVVLFVFCLLVVLVRLLVGAYTYSDFQNIQTYLLTYQCK